MEIRSHKFQSRAKDALLDASLQAALDKARGGFVDKRAAAVDELPQFESLRERAVMIKNRVLSDLDAYLETFERNVTAAGGVVHWASTPEEGVEAILRICQDAGARRVAKGKSMIGEEISLNEALEAQGMEVVETDLGEYIIQLAGEHPSHIIAPAIHKTRDQITDLFQKHHARYGIQGRREDVASIVDEARAVLREAFVSADVGITGANFLLADTGSTVLVTNEGNGDLASSLPRVHIVTASIEKVLPSHRDLSVFLRLLGRSATGQEMSAYTSIYSGPKRDAELGGAEEFHVLLLDNGRSGILASEYWELLRCIRCGACMNHCPVYQSVGGHAYGWVYPGPMGSVWTPLLAGLKKAANLPNACTLNGRCEQVCPVSIPLPRMLLSLRKELFERGWGSAASRLGVAAWGLGARSPLLYRFVGGALAGFLSRLGRRQGSFRRLPLAGGWTATRDFPAPTGRDFVSQWHSARKER